MRGRGEGGEEEKCILDRSLCLFTSLTPGLALGGFRLGNQQLDGLQLPWRLC